MDMISPKSINETTTGLDALNASLRQTQNEFAAINDIARKLRGAFQNSARHPGKRNENPEESGEGKSVAMGMARALAKNSGSGAVRLGAETLGMGRKLIRDDASTPAHYQRKHGSTDQTVAGINDFEKSGSGFESQFEGDSFEIAGTIVPPASEIMDAASREASPGMKALKNVAVGPNHATQYIIDAYKQFGSDGRDALNPYRQSLLPSEDREQNVSETGLTRRNIKKISPGNDPIANGEEELRSANRRIGGNIVGEALDSVGNQLSLFSLKHLRDMVDGEALEDFKTLFGNIGELNTPEHRRRMIERHELPGLPSGGIIAQAKQTLARDGFPVQERTIAPENEAKRVEMNQVSEAEMNDRFMMLPFGSGERDIGDLRHDAVQAEPSAGITQTITINVDGSDAHAAADVICSKLVEMAQIHHPNSGFNQSYS